MGTRKNNKKSKKSNKRFRKTRSKRQRGGGKEENDAFIKAIQDGDTDEVRELLYEGADVRAVNNDYETPLFLASELGHTEIVDMLLQFGADANHASSRTSHPLIEASKNGHTEIVELLVNNGAKNRRGNYGYTALQHAIENGHTKTARRLIELGDNVNRHYHSVPQNTPLIEASENGYTETVAMLLENGADVNAENSDGDTALMLARKNGHNDIVKLLFKKHIVAQTLPRHLERQQNRLQVGRVMDSKKMPGDLTHKIITEHFGGKRKTRKSKKSKRKRRKTRRKL